MNLATLERRMTTLAAQLAPPAVPMTALEVARLAGFTGLDGWQEAVLLGRGNTLMLCGRQVGKTTTAALKAIHQAVAHPGTTTIITAPTLRQSQLLYAKVRTFHAALGTAAPAMVEESALRFRLANAAQVVAVPGDQKGIRGYTAHLVIEDEAALVSDDTFAAIAPMVATTGGPIILLSTPHGQRGHFFSLWDSGDPAWARAMMTSLESARIDADWLAEQRRALPDYQFRQEFGCEFVQTDDAYFAASDIDAAASGTAPPLFPLVKVA